MPRALLMTSLLLLAPLNVHAADAFDLYTNFVIRDGIDEKKFRLIDELTPEMITEFDQVLPDAKATTIFVRSNDGRHTKLLVRRARIKVKDEQVPILHIVRWVTYRPAIERAIFAQGENVYLYPGFEFQVDHGQVVPAHVGGDLRVVAADDSPLSLSLKPIKEAKIYLLDKALPNLAPKKAEKLVVGETFEIRYFAGKYKLYDDGRRSGELVLAVDEKGDITGSYYSDRDGLKYDVVGKVGTPKHSLTFTVQLPRTEQVFQGHLFTGNGKAIAGSSKMQGREAGFYAERIEE